MPSSETYYRFRKAISADHDENMKAIPRKQRAMVRKGIKAELSGEIDSDIDTFYPIYATGVRNLGTPVFSRRYFSCLKEIFADDCEVLVVREQDQPVSSVMSFYFRDEVLPYYGGGLDRARQVKGFDFLYWDLMVRAVERGARFYDFGRSKTGTGAYSFKKNWGFEPELLSYQYELVRATEVPQRNPNNPKYRMLIDAWKKLPLPVANLIGPIISKSLG